MTVQVGDDQDLTGTVAGLEPAGLGWEHFLRAQIPEQLATLKDQILAQAALDRQARPCEVGRYTLVCDGATMASLLEHTLGLATQLDRALGSEANANGTSFLDDPLAMVGHLPVASPLVTVTANRTAPAALATVQWDDEGVAPQPFTLVQDGVLTDFQTTRAQAAWLASYYQAHGRPVRSNGCAAAEDAHGITGQHMPNLTLEPRASGRGLDALVAGVPDGLLIEGGVVTQCDAQARTGLLQVDKTGPTMMRRITQGHLGPRLNGGAVQFETKDLWTHVLAVGGTQTVQGTVFSQYPGWLWDQALWKGEPPQRTSHSVRAAAAVLANQPVIAVGRRG